MNSHQLINQSSGNTELYTPSFIIEAARATLGCIDLDPASSLIANQRVQANRIYTQADNALKKDWQAETIWMNHPFSKAENAKWIMKFIFAAELARATWPKGAGLCITFASTSEKWFQPLLDYPQCFLSPRTNYILPSGETYKGVTKGSVVTYIGPDLEAFKKNFSPFGKIKI